MYKINKGFNCRTTKGTNLEVNSGTMLEKYEVNYDRNSITLTFPDMTCEVENDFDIAEYIGPVSNERRYLHEQENTRNWNRRGEVAVILKYLKQMKNEYDGRADASIVSFLKTEIEIFETEYNKLNILTADDCEVIQNALRDYAESLESMGNEVADKINNVRDRYIKMFNDFKYEKEMEKK